MRPTSRAAFWQAPSGRCVIGRHHCVGCFDEKLRIAALWGRPDEDDARAFVDLLEVAFHDDLRPPLLALTDVSRIERADPAAFRVVAEYLEGRRSRFDKILGRQALVRPKNGVVAAVVAGFYGALGSQRSVRVFTDCEDGLEWLGASAPRASAMAAELTRLIEEVAGGDAVLSALRRRLDEEPRTALESFARELGMTGRALQRHLEQLTPPTRFRDEVAAAKFRMAEQLVRQSDLKIATVASRVGLPQAKLRRLFREAQAKTPTGVRAEAVVTKPRRRR